MKNEKCGSCKYFDGKEKKGYCIRFPPVYVGLPEYWLYPNVYNIDWCGEWKKKKN